MNNLPYDPPHCQIDDVDYCAAWYADRAYTIGHTHQAGFSDTGRCRLPQPKPRFTDYLWFIGTFLAIFGLIATALIGGGVGDVIPNLPPEELGRVYRQF